MADKVKVERKFLDKEAQQEAGVIRHDVEDEAHQKKVIPIASHAPRGGAPVVASISSITSLYQQDAPPCPDCGAIMIRSGACYKCMNCGAVSGCS
jgi:ribonucleoside-diphosphate reductase alpha chain